MTFAPSVANHRIAMQCGAATMNGERMKPDIVSGAQYVVSTPNVVFGVGVKKRRSVYGVK